MNDAQILALYITGIWIHLAPSLSKQTREIVAMLCALSALAMAIRIVF
jgi:hypothetical protein